MPTIDFTQKEAPDATAPAEPKQVPAVQQSQTPAEYHRTSDAEGEIGRDDVSTPRLNIVAKTGDLSTTFTPGSLVLNKAIEFKTGVNVIALFIKKYYREACDFDNPHTDRPQLFTTAAEANAAGFRVGKPTTRAYEEEVAPQADILFFVEKPDDATEEQAEAFATTLPSGKVGALVMFTATKTTYNTVAKGLFTALSMNKVVKEIGLTGQRWKLDTTSEKFEKKSWFQGRLVPAGKVDVEDAAALKELVGA